jgi:threonylcarbamoyladenosine tRNA methylthiotransferase MtaB
MPHCCIGVDVIVGFPGESDALFQETFDYLHALDISYLHVFTYSERDNTQAIHLKEVVPMQLRKQRNAILRQLSEKKMNYFTNQHIGSVRATLFEHAEKSGMMEGYTDNYIKISQAFDPLKVNQIVMEKI